MTDAPAPSGTEFWVIDGLEDTPDGRVARLERPDGSTVTLDLQRLPAGSREGDVLSLQDGPDGAQFQSAPQETQRRKDLAQRQLNSLSQPYDGQEIDL